jgi:outer membrane lipoprotein-sorting protein
MRKESPSMSKTLAVALLGFAWAAAAPAQTVDEIVARNAAARGGAGPWRSVRSMKMSGRMEVGQGLEVPFRLELKRPHKMRLEFDFNGATAVSTYDGARGWKLLPFHGRREATAMSEGELVTAAGQAELDGPLIDYGSKGHRLELEGNETREAFKLKLTLKGGAVRHVYVDAETGLETRIEAPHRLRGEDKVLGTRFGDYRTVGGLAIPHLLESRIEGAPYSHKLTITSVEIDVPLPDARFGKPMATPSSATPSAPRTSASSAASRAAARREGR